MNDPTLRERFANAMKTPGYQLEHVLLDVTERLCEIMKADGINKTELARRLGKSSEWVTKLLRGDRGLTVKTITHVFWELGYQVDFQATPLPEHCRPNNNQQEEP